MFRNHIDISRTTQWGKTDICIPLRCIFNLQGKNASILSYKVNYLNITSSDQVQEPDVLFL